MQVFLRRRAIFGRKSNESDSIGQSSLSRLYDDITLQGDEEWKRTVSSLIPSERGRVDSEGLRKSF